MDIKPTVLDSSNEIILLNWPNKKRIVCTTNNNIPISIPSHPYVLLNRSVLCHCDIEAEDIFLLESLAACDPPSSDSDLIMYFTTNLAFINYFDSLIETMEIPILQNWAMQEQILPISLEPLEFNKSLLQVLKTLKEFVAEYKWKKEITDLQIKNLDKVPFFNNIIIDIFMFAAAVITLVVVFIIIIWVCKHMKLKTLVSSIALQQYT